MAIKKTILDELELSDNISSLEKCPPPMENPALFVTLPLRKKYYSLVNNV